MAETKSTPKRKRLKGPSFHVPQGVIEADEEIAKLAKVERKITELETQLNKRIAEIHAGAKEEARPLLEQSAMILKGLHAFASANRATLTDGEKKKTIDLPSGSMSWRTTPPAVSIKGKMETVIERIKKLGLAEQFIRVSEEINKSAMLEDPEKAKSIEGISIRQVEQFYVRLRELGVEVSSPRQKKKKDGKQKKTDA